jgi:FkbM family methyltransferase
MQIDVFLYDSPAFKSFLQDNPHERGETEFLESIVGEGMNAIDIGANIGITSMALARKIGKAGKVYSFEPTPEYFNILRKNVRLNGLEDVVNVRELAVTDQVGRACFYHKGLSTGIVPEEGAERFEVRTVNVDRFLNEEKIERIDLIHMDCEGSELLALKGAIETLRRNEVMIFCEIHHDFLRQLGQSVEDVVAYLQSLEFQVHGVSLDELEVGSSLEDCDYVYASNLNKRRNHG